MALPLKWMPAYSHGGAFVAGQPTVVVIHSTESENNPGTAEALAGPNWFGGSKAGTSSHKVVDVDSICEGVKRNIVAYHAGPGGNVRGIAYEMCGRAGWTAAQWRAPAQLQMLRNAAPHIADDLRSMGAAARWLSLAQLGAREKGLCTHNDIRLVFGGTTHSDPGPNFPYAELLQYVNEALGVGGPTLRFPVIGRIREAYDRVGGRVGQPRGPEVKTLDIQGRWQEFDNGAIYWHPAVDAGRAHSIQGDILKRWRQLGSEPTTGFPTTDELPTPDGKGRFNHFAGAGNTGVASIYWSQATGAQPIWGMFRSWWAQNGWELGPAGYPTSGEYRGPGNVITQDFQNGKVELRGGQVLWTPKGPVEVRVLGASQ